MAIAVVYLTVLGAAWLDVRHLDYEDASPAVVLIGFGPALAPIVTTTAG